MDIKPSRVSNVLEGARAALKEASRRPATPTKRWQDRIPAGHERPMSAGIQKMDIGSRSRARIDARPSPYLPCNYVPKTARPGQSPCRPISAVPSPVRAHHITNDSDEEVVDYVDDDESDESLDDVVRRLLQDDEDRDKGLLEQLEDWRAHLTALLEQLDADIRGKRWKKVEGSIGLFDAMLDPLLSSVCMHQEEEDGSTRALLLLRERAKMSFLSIAADGNGGSLRLQALRLCLKLLRLEISTFCHQQRQIATHTDPTYLPFNSIRATPTLVHLGQACDYAHQLSADSQNDVAFLTTFTLDAMLSLLGADTEILLEVVQVQLQPFIRRWKLRRLQGSEREEKKWEEGLEEDGREASHTEMMRREAISLYVVSMLQPLIHSAGVIKNLSGADNAQALRDRMSKLGAIHVCTGVLVKGRKVMESLKVGKEAQPSTNPMTTSRNTAGNGLIQFPAGSAVERDRWERDEVVATFREKALVLLQQVAGALRNLTLDKAMHRQIIAAQLPQVLISLIQPLARENPELMLQVARILSKLSLHEKLRACINSDPAHLRDLMYLLECNTVGNGTSHIYGEFLQPQSTALVVRVAYVLGNLTATNSGNRRLVGLRFRGVEVGVELLELLASMFLAMKEGDGEEQGGESEENKGKGKGCGGKRERSRAEMREEAAMCAQLQEVLVKVLRFVGNLVMDRDVARAVLRTAGVELLLSLVDWCIEVAKGKKGGGEGGEVKDEEEELDGELLCNIVGVLANLSGHMASGDALWAHRTEIAMNLYGILLRPTQVEEALCDAARALGNLCRDVEVRQAMEGAQADRTLALLLEHGSRQVIAAVVGALVNLMGKREGFQGLSVGKVKLWERLVELLEKSRGGDLDMSFLLCKCLYNMVLGYDGTDGQEVERLEELDEVLSEIVEHCHVLLEKSRGEGKGEGEQVASLYRPCLSVARTLQQNIRFRDKRRVMEVVHAEGNGDEGNARKCV